MGKILGPLLTILLVIGVGLAIFKSVKEKAGVGSTVNVRGVIGSEKDDFFHDPRVLEIFKKQGLDVQV